MERQQGNIFVRKGEGGRFPLVSVPSPSLRHKINFGKASQRNALLNLGGLDCLEYMVAL